MKDVFTIDIFNETVEKGMFDAYSSRIYYDIEEAIKDAKKCILGWVGYEGEFIEVTVFAGEEEDEEGNMFGDDFDVYTISNMSQEKTMRLRKDLGYTDVEVDAYVENGRVVEN